MSNKYLPLYALILFAAIGITLWLSFDTIFYVFNFAYIGSFLSLGAYLTQRRNKYARNIVQIGVGLYMFGFLGLIMGENMQIEGFWYFLFLGVFQAAVIHYAVAKIAGPFLFGRGWCGYACWTAAVLDLLPYKTPKGDRIKKLGILRYIIFVLSFCFIAALFVFKVENIDRIMYISFIAGNLIYYIVGIALAFGLKDNRAFCKYVCPITTFLKPASYFSLLRIKVNQNSCVHCGKCKRACPMDVDMLNNKRSRKNGTECILCYNCVKVCSKKETRLFHLNYYNKNLMWEYIMSKKMLKRIFLGFIVLYGVIFAARAVYDLITFQDTDITNNYNIYYSGEKEDSSIKNYASQRMEYPAEGAATSVMDQKYERIASIMSKTVNYDADLERFNAILEENKAVVQMENSRGLSGSRRIDLVIGVRPENFDVMQASVSQIGRIISSTTIKTDKTYEYRQMLAEKETLESRRTSYEELKKRDVPTVIRTEEENSNGSNKGKRGP